MTFLALLAAFLTVGLGRLLWYAYGVYHKSQLLSAMPGPPRCPGLLNIVLGNLGDLAGNQYHFTTTQWAKQYGGMTKLRLFDTYIALVADPAIASELLKDRSLDKSRHAYQILDALFDDKGHSGLLTSQMTPQWRTIRRAVASALSPQSLRDSFPKLRSVAHRLVDNMKVHGSQSPVDMDLMCAKLSWDIIGIVGFDTDMGATKLSQHADDTSSTIATVRAGMQEIEQRWGQPFRHSLWKYLLPSAKKGERDLKQVHVIIRDLLQKLRKADPQTMGNTIAGQLLRLKDPATGEPMSDDVIMPEIGTMFLAGFETSGHTEAWALYLISQHPEVEERILQELAQHQLTLSGDGSIRDIQYEDLARLTYLNCVIKETLRLYPAGPSTDRLAPRDMRVGGYFIPKGTIFWISLYTIQHLASIHPDPEAFRPERWLDPNYVYATPGAAPTAPQAEQPTGNSPGKADSETDSSAASGDESWVVLGNQKPAALDAKDALNRPKRWFPFSEGARSCVGQPLANMNVTGTLATLLARFHFTLADQMGGTAGVRASENVAITLAPSKGLFMHAEARQAV